MRQVVFQSVSGSPDTAEWHAWRGQGIGGSDAPVIAHEAGLCAKAGWMKGINHLFQLKTGQIQPEDLSRNPAVMRGKRGEEPARIAYEKQTGILVSPVFGEMDLHPFIRSSLDGRNFEGSVIVEIKCPGEKSHNLAKFGRVVDYYKPQLAHQGLVSWGPPEGWDPTFELHYASFVPETGDLAIVDKKAKDYRKLAEELMKAEIAFWDRVRNNVAPCGEEFLAAAAAYIEASSRFEAVKEEQDALKAKLVELLGKGKSLDGGGVSVTRTPVKGRIDSAAWVASLLPGKTKEDLEVLGEPFRGAPSESVTVRISKTAKPAKQSKEVA